MRNALETLARPLTVLVADDEPLAREILRDLLALDPEVVVAGECGDGETALARIRERRPDIVFLDIEMPGRSGIEALAELPAEGRPIVVYVTAYGQHAVRAYDLEALDYVLKPFSDERFFAALGRAKRRARERDLSAIAASLAASRRETAPRGGAVPTAKAAAASGAAPMASGAVPVTSGGRYPDRLLVKRGERSLLLPVDTLRWIESEDYYVRLHVEGASYLLRTSLGALEARLDPARFLRVHRTAIVRRDLVRELRTSPAGGRVLVLDDGAEVPVARARARQVEQWLAQPR